MFTLTIVDLEVLPCDFSSWWPLASSYVWTPSCTSSPFCPLGCCWPSSAFSPCHAVASGQSLNTHSPTYKHKKIKPYKYTCIPKETHRFSRFFCQIIGTKEFYLFHILKKNFTIFFLPRAAYSANLYCLTCNVARMTNLRKRLGVFTCE